MTQGLSNTDKKMPDLDPLDWILEDIRELVYDRVSVCQPEDMEEKLSADERDSYISMAANLIWSALRHDVSRMAKTPVPGQQK